MMMASIAGHPLQGFPPSDASPLSGRQGWEGWSGAASYKEVSCCGGEELLLTEEEQH
jgi:hypothetical protein